MLEAVQNLMLASVVLLIIVGLLIIAAGIILYRLVSGHLRRDLPGAARLKLSAGVPTIAEAVALRPSGGRLRIGVDVSTLRQYTDDTYQVRVITVPSDTYTVAVLDAAFPDYRHLAHMPMPDPVGGEALYKVYVEQGTTALFPVYYELRKRSGGTAEADDRDDAAFVSELMRKLRAAQEQTGTDDHG
jgi:hypothetical protein